VRSEIDEEPGAITHEAALAGDRIGDERREI